MSTVTKLGAYGLAVAAAFAVAFAVLVTAPRSSVNAQDSNDNTPTPDVTIEAYTEAAGPGTADDSDDSNDVAEFATPSATPAKESGDSVYIQVYDLGIDAASTGPTVAVPTLFRFSVNNASDASGTFKSGGGTSLNCADQRTACDLDSDIDDMIVQFDIDDDAKDNSSVVIDVNNVNANKSVRVVISVTRAPVPAKLIVKVGSLDAAEARQWPTAISAEPDRLEALGRTELNDDPSPLQRGMTRIFVQVEDKDGDPVPQKLTITSTGGLVFAERFFQHACGSIPSSGPSLGTSYCNAENFDGHGFIAVWGSGRPGVSTVTFTSGRFTETVEITLYGDAKTIEAEAEQSSVQAGGSVFIVATVTDGAGNAVQGHVVELGTGDDVVKAPAGDDSVPVDVANNVPKDVDPGTANDLPDCDAGTNGKGKCVVQVTAPNPEGTANDATRGTHTITLVGSAPIVAADRKVKVDITVAAAVETIETNAPDRVDFGSRTEIKVTLKDDAGVLAGAQAVKVTQVDGGGRVIGGGEALTSNGSRSFTYRAANSPGTAEFDIEVRGINTAGDAGTGKVLLTETLSIAVGPAPEPPAPAQPTAAGISSDAPERVEPGSSTNITVTVTDADGERAGMQSVTAEKVSGDGRIINGGPAATADGQHTFTFRAASTTGVTEIDVEVRSLNEDGAATTTGRVLATLALTIAVGPAPEPPAPAQPIAAGISSDAPERVEPGSSTDITVTVTDADGEQAGMQSVTATQVSGAGRIINGGPATTADGRYTFTFRAALTTGVAEIDVDVRSLDEDGAATTAGRVLVTRSLTIQVGEPEPEMATLTPPPSGSGVALTTFSGGSLSDLQAVLLGECSSASVAAYATVRGSLVPYIPGARIAAVNAAFIADTVTDGMVPASPLLVSGCD